MPTTFPISYGDPQTVEVNAKKSLGAVRVYWQVNGGAVHSAPDDASTRAASASYHDPGTYYHHLRGAGHRAPSRATRVKVWFQAGKKHSRTRSPTRRRRVRNKVLLRGRRGLHRAEPGARAGQDRNVPGLLRAGAAGREHRLRRLRRRRPERAPRRRRSACYSHYKAVIWETGDDLYTREPGQPGGTGVSKLLDEEIIAARDYMNDGGKVLVAGKTALQGAWDQFLYNPLGPTPPKPFCASNQTQGNGDADDPPGQNFNCVVVSNDFQQYWLGAYLPITLSDDPDAIATFTMLENAAARHGARSRSTAPTRRRTRTTSTRS